MKASPQKAVTYPLVHDQREDHPVLLPRPLAAQPGKRAREGLGQEGGADIEGRGRSREIEDGPVLRRGDAAGPVQLGLLCGGGGGALGCACV